MTAITLSDLPQPAELAPPYRPLGHGRRAANWLTEEQVAADQRRRLYGAMIELVAERGYAAISTVELAKLARTSKRDIYKRFGNKEGYFLATYDVIVAHAIERVAGAYAGEHGWRERLGCAFRALASEIVEQPRAARLGLCEILGAGPAGLDRVDRTKSIFEAMVGASFAEGPAGPLPPIVVKGIVSGIQRIVRQRLLAGREHELPELAEQLLAWVLSYHTPAVAELGDEALPAAPRAEGPLRQSPRDVRVYLLRIAAELAATDGWRALSSRRVADCAELPARQVRDLCGTDPRRCFMEALRLLSAEALARSRRAARRSSDRIAGLYLGIQALMCRLEEDRTLCRLAFVEVFALGPTATGERDALLGAFTSALSSALPRDARPSPLIAEASASALCGVIHYHVTHDQVGRLPALAAQLAYLALAPAIGAEQAIDTLKQARREK